MHVLEGCDSWAVDLEVQVLPGVTLQGSPPARQFEELATPKRFQLAHALISCRSKRVRGERRRSSKRR